MDIPRKMNKKSSDLNFFMLLYFVIDMCDNLKKKMKKYNIVIKKTTRYATI